MSLWESAGLESDMVDLDAGISSRVVHLRTSLSAFDKFHSW